MHRGAGANSGHYIAQVQDIKVGKLSFNPRLTSYQTSTWYEFDDDVCGKIEDNLIGLVDGLGTGETLLFPHTLPLS